MTPPLVLRALTPANRSADDELQVVDQRVPALPHTMTLADGLVTTLVLPTGVARAWLHEPGDAVVSSASTQLEADGSRSAATLTAAFQLPPQTLRPRVLVIRDRRAVAAFPAVVGHRWVVPELADVTGRPAEIAVLDWHLDVATVLGLPSAGGSVRIAWRWLDVVVAPPRLPVVRDVAWAAWLDDPAMAPEDGS